jgi:hypothetical protein
MHTASSTMECEQNNDQSDRNRNTHTERERERKRERARMRTVSYDAYIAKVKAMIAKVEHNRLLQQ